MIKNMRIRNISVILLPAIFLAVFLTAPTPLFAACPDGLVPVYRNNGPICAYVYGPTEALPAGCTDRNDLLSFLCHPELHGSFQLLNQTVSGDCVLNPPSALNPNCGWVLLTSGEWMWNGPGARPSTPPPNANNLSTNPADNDVYRTCAAVLSINSGQTPVVLFSGGTNRPATQNELLSPSYLSAVNACNAGTYYNPAPAPTLIPIPNPNLNPVSTTTSPSIVGSNNISGYLNSVLNIINSTLQRMLSAYNSIIQNDALSSTQTPATAAGGSIQGSLGPARYLKVSLSKLGWISAREMEVYDAAHNKLSATPTGSGDYPGGYLYDSRMGSSKPLSVNNLVDGDIESVWHAGESLPQCMAGVWLPASNCPFATRNAWVQLDLGAIKDISRVRIMTLGGDSVVLSVSSDGQSFAELATFPPSRKDREWAEYPSSPAGNSPITVSVSAEKLNVRSAPVTSALIVRQLNAGETFIALGWIIGENIDGSAKWWRTSDDNYVWAGGTEEQP